MKDAGEGAPLATARASTEAPTSCETANGVEPVLRRTLAHGAGAALVAMFAYSTASFLPNLHEAYWAAMAAVVVLAPERSATIKAGVQQLFGSAVGGLIGWACATWWHHHVLIYGAAVLFAVSVCLLLRLPNAARISGVAVTITTLIPSQVAPATIALHRFIEVSYGAACAVAYTAAIEGLAALRVWSSSRTRPRHAGTA